MLFQTPAYIQSVRTLVDGGNKVEIITRELQPSEMTELFALKGKEGWIVMKENTITTDDIKDLPEIKVDKGDKTKAQRLRACIYKLWETTNQTKTSEEFYNEYMEKIITQIKEKL